MSNTLNAMQKIDSEMSLKAAVAQLERQRTEEEKLLKEQFLLTFESIKPINLIKSTIKDVTTAPEIRNNAVNIIVGLGVSYVSKILFERMSKSPMKKLFSTVLEFGIITAIEKNPEGFKAMRTGIMEMIREKLGGGKKHLPEPTQNGTKVLT